MLTNTSKIGHVEVENFVRFIHAIHPPKRSSEPPPSHRHMGRSARGHPTTHTTSSETCLLYANVPVWLLLWLAFLSELKLGAYRGINIRVKLYLLCAQCQVLLPHR